MPSFIGFQIPSSASGGATSSDAAASERPSKKAKVSEAETVAELKDPKHQALRVGFGVGEHVTLRKQPKECKTREVFKIAAFDETANLAEVGHTTLLKTMSIDFTTLVKEWKLVKGAKGEQGLKGFDIEAKLCSPLNSVDWELDVVKGAIASHIRDAYGLHEVHRSRWLLYSSNPWFAGLFRTKW